MGFVMKKIGKNREVTFINDIQPFLAFFVLEYFGVKYD